MASINLENAATTPDTPEANTVEMYPESGRYYSKDAAGDIARLSFAEGEITDAYLGDRTINDATVPADDTDTLTQLLSMLANRIKAITGKDDWFDSPDRTIASLNTAVIHGAAGTRIDVTKTLVAAPSGATDTETIAFGEYTGLPYVWCQVETADDSLVGIVTKVYDNSTTGCGIRWYAADGLTPAAFYITVFSMGVPV